MSRWVRKLFALGVAGSLVTAAILAGCDFDSPVEIERDRQPVFQIDPDEPYEISVGEDCLPYGDGTHIVIHSDGRVVMTRTTYTPARRSQSAAYTLSPEGLSDVLGAVESNRVTELHRGYRRANTFDGLCWGIAIKQGAREKRVSCANHFPDEVTRFKNQLGAILGRYGKGLKWREVEQP